MCLNARPGVAWTMAGRLARGITGALGGLLAVPAVVQAHTGIPPAPHDLWVAWSWEPASLAGLALAAWLYGRGNWLLWPRIGAGRRRAIGQLAAVTVGWLTLAVALISPLAALGEALFSAHMAQHLLLVLIAAPLLALGNPRPALVWGLPAGWRPLVGRWLHRPLVRRAGRLLVRLLVAWTLSASVLWLWHAPAFFEAALARPAIHAIEHASLLGTAWLFWHALAVAGRRGPLGHGAGVLATFIMGLQGSLLGALITLAGQPWYPAYGPHTAAWGQTLLADQQLAGLLMWVPAGAVYLIAAGALFLAWLDAVERSVRRHERPASASLPVPAGDEGTA